MGENSRYVLEVVMQSEQHEPADERPQRRDMVPSPKASDADREAALERLRDAFADGRLTEEELDQRTRAALAGRTTITAIGVMGGFDVVVPQGVQVESSDYGVLCGTWNYIPEQELPADAPVVRLRTIGVLSWAATKPKFLYEMPD
jgi:acetyl-CoA carboxylase carboxyltransferase component